MTNEERETLFKERFSSLPKTIQLAIINSDWLTKVRDICRRSNLMLDQSAVVENVVFSVMLGFFEPSEAEKELLDAELDSKVVSFLIAEIDKQIFAPIKEELVESFNKFTNEYKSDLETDNSLDALTGEVHMDTQEQEREEMLREIENFDASTNIKSDETETVSGVPAGIVTETVAENPTEATTDKPVETTTTTAPVSNTPEQAKEANPLEKKLGEAVSVEPKIVKIDPYREQIE